MSEKSRAPSSACGSIFLASQWAAALSSTAPRAVRNCTKIGTEILYIETVIGLPRWLQCHVRTARGEFTTSQRARGAGGRRRLGGAQACLRPIIHSGPFAAAGLGP